jgi:hypothetical protein
MESEDSSPLHKSHQEILRPAAWILYTSSHPICRKIHFMAYSHLPSTRQSSMHSSIYPCTLHAPSPSPDVTKIQLRYSESPWDVNSRLPLKRLPTHFMEPKGSLPCLQQSATKLYPRPNTSSPHPSNLESLLILYSYSSLRIWSSLFPSGFPNDTLYAFIHSSMRDTCPSNSSPFTWPFKWQLITHTNYEVLHYTLASSLTPPSYIQPSFLSMLFSERINPCSSLHATDCKLCQYNATDNYYFVHLHLYICISYK